MTKLPLPAFGLLLGSALVGCTGSGGTPVVPEVAESQIQLELPAVPTFEEPQANSDGTHSVIEMRRRGKKFLDQDVKVKGFVVSVYDCAAVLGAQVAKDTPEKCDRPHFWLGDSKDAAPEKSVWIVEVPRPLRDDEKRFLPKEELKNLPPVPKMAVGDQVVVDGKWATRSPKGFVNSDGLLVYANLTPVAP